LVTNADASHDELPPCAIETIVNHGGMLRVSTLSSADNTVLADIRRLIDDWYRDRLRIRTLCRRLKSSFYQLNHLNANWFDSVRAKVSELWIVAFGRCGGRARVLTIEKATRDDIHGLLDEIEQLVQAPLREVAPSN
jgi:hypothetical protein